MDWNITDSLNSISIIKPQEWRSQVINKQRTESQQNVNEIIGNFSENQNIQSDSVKLSEKILWEPKLNYDQWGTINWSSLKWQHVNFKV